VTLQGGGGAGAKRDCCRIRRGLDQALNVCGLHLHNGMRKGSRHRKCLMRPWAIWQSQHEQS
jgi:hypothetical protein